MKLAICLQIQPLIMQVGRRFLAGLCKGMLTFSGPSLMASSRLLHGFILIPPGKTQYHHVCYLSDCLPAILSPNKGLF